MDDDGHVTKIVIKHGINPHTGAGSVGGSNAYIDDDGKPVVMLVPGTNDGRSTRVVLHVGETFEIGPEVWEVTEIRNPDTSFWAADLNRIR